MSSFPNNHIKYVMLDIDGCITDGKNQPIDLEAMLRLQQSIAISDKISTICTGRSATYVEAIAQMLHVKDWCICENGAYLYHPITDKLIYNPLIQADNLNYLQKLRNTFSVDSNFVKILKLELGKEICISLNPLMGDITHLYQILLDYVDTDRVDIHHSTTAVDITPRGVNKGNAFDFWCTQFDIKPKNVLGVGDSKGDLSFLLKCGFVACPNNAVNEIKELANFISSSQSTLGLNEIFEWMNTEYIKLRHN